MQKGIDKARTYLQTDGVNEQYQAKFTNEMHKVSVQRDAEMTEGDTGKQDAGDPQFQPETGNVANGQSGGYHQAEDQDRV